MFIKHFLIPLLAIFFLSCSDDPTSSKETLLTDIDGNVYQTIKIGDQWWMAENLKVTHYRNGEAISNVTDNLQWTNLSSGAYCIHNYADDVETYGLLYNWYTVNDSRNIAPAGWHVPTDEEWKQLEMFLGMSQTDADNFGWRGTDEGGKLKEEGTTHWIDPNTGATNESGFSALPGGRRNHDNGFCVNIAYTTHFWSSTTVSDISVWCRILRNSYSGVYRNDYHKRSGYSVRCVMD